MADLKMNYLSPPFSQKLIFSSCVLYHAYFHCWIIQARILSQLFWLTSILFVVVVRLQDGLQLSSPSAIWIFLWSPSTMHHGWFVWPKNTLEVMVCDFPGYVIRESGLISLSFRSLALEEASGHVIKILKQPYGEALIGKKWSLLSTVNIKLSVIRVNHLGHGSSNPNQTFRWCSPGQHLECNLRDPEPEPSAKLFLNLLTHRKLWDDIFIIISSWYTFGGICYKETDD